MPKRLRRGLQGAAFHVMNRAVRKTILFQRDEDYDAFIRVVVQSLKLFKIGIISFELMPNHWHFVITCDRIEEVSNWMHWVNGTHANRWNGAHGTRGSGAVYQGRFRAVPIQSGASLIRVCRYVERNALRKGLVSDAEKWKWSSLYSACNNCDLIPLVEWPIPKPSNWLEIVNSDEMSHEFDDLRASIRRNQPIGDPDWKKAVAPFIGQSMRRRGRPKKMVPTP